MRFLLDTNVVSDFMKAYPPVIQRYSTHTPDELAISCVTVQEITYGFTRQPEAHRRLGKVWQSLLNTLNVLPFDLHDAEQAAAVRGELRRKGTPIGPYDVQLAGTALAQGLILVTNNTGEFSRVPLLRLEDWRYQS